MYDPFSYIRLISAPVPGGALYQSLASPPTLLCRACGRHPTAGAWRRPAAALAEHALAAGAFTQFPPKSGAPVEHGSPLLFRLELGRTFRREGRRLGRDAYENLRVTAGGRIRAAMLHDLLLLRVGDHVVLVSPKRRSR